MESSIFCPECEKGSVGPCAPCAELALAWLDHDMDVDHDEDHGPARVLTECEACGEDAEVEGGAHEVEGEVLCLDCYGEVVDHCLFA